MYVERFKKSSKTEYFNTTSWFIPVGIPSNETTRVVLAKQSLKFVDIKEK